MSALLEASGVALPGRLQPVDLALESGTFTALIGPNGGGKTSLLRGLARVERSPGMVWICGEDVDKASPARRRRLLSFLPAARHVAWPISARDLIALSMDRTDPGRVAELIDTLDLQLLADRPTDQLSTGERARVLLARALASKPSVLLLDEPLSNLDPYWVLRILDLLREAAQQGAAALVALHDLTLLPRFDRALLVAEGRLLADGLPHDMLHESSFEAAFRVRSTNGSWQISPEADRRSSR